MKAEDKDLLLKDLCARLPYGVKILHTGWDCDGDTDFDTVETLIGIDDRFIYTVWDKTGDREKHCLSVSNWKPYLRPMSSMTEEEQYFIEDKFAAKIDSGNGCYIEHYTSSESGVSEVYMENVCELIRYLNSRHFDYQRKYDEKDGTWKTMIEMGLALPAPEGMYNF